MPDINPPDAPRAIHALTGLRGYAALWVVVSHLSYTDSLLFPLGIRLAWQRAAGVIMHEYLAVDLFFMLSGFVLAHVHGDEFARSVSRSVYGRFLLLRLARIYPLHAIALGLMAVVHPFLADPAGVSNLHTFILNATLTSSWGLGPRLSWNLPAWSLSSEWFAYLLFPIVALAAAGLRSVRSQSVGLGALLLLFYGVMFLQPYPLDYSSGPGAQIRVMVGVAIGAVLRGLYADQRVQRLPWDWILWISVPIALATMTEWSGTRRPNNIWAYGMLPVFLMGAALGRGPLMAPLTGDVPRYLGRISYALYIFHYPVMRVIRRLAADDLARIAAGGTMSEVRLVCGLVLLAVFVSAVAAHHLVEDPFRRWVKRRIARTIPVAAVAS